MMMMMMMTNHVLKKTYTQQNDSYHRLVIIILLKISPTKKRFFYQGFDVFINLSHHQESFKKNVQYLNFHTIACNCLIWDHDSNSHAKVYSRTLSTGPQKCHSHVVFTSSVPSPLDDKRQSIAVTLLPQDIWTRRFTKFYSHNR